MIETIIIGAILGTLGSVPSALAVYNCLTRPSGNEELAVEVVRAIDTFGDDDLTAGPVRDGPYTGQATERKSFMSLFKRGKTPPPKSVPPTGPPSSSSGPGGPTPPISPSKSSSRSDTTLSVINPTTHELQAAECLAHMFQAMQVYNHNPFHQTIIEQVERLESIREEPTTQPALENLPSVHGGSPFSGLSEFMSSEAGTEPEESSGTWQSQIGGHPTQVVATSTGLVKTIPASPGPMDFDNFDDSAIERTPRTPRTRITTGSGASWLNTASPYTRDFGVQTSAPTSSFIPEKRGYQSTTDSRNSGRSFDSKTGTKPPTTHQGDNGDGSTSDGRSSPPCVGGGGLPPPLPHVPFSAAGPKKRAVRLGFLGQIVQTVQAQLGLLEYNVANKLIVRRVVLNLMMERGMTNTDINRDIHTVVAACFIPSNAVLEADSLLNTSWVGSRFADHAALTGTNWTRLKLLLGRLFFVSSAPRLQTGVPHA